MKVSKCFQKKSAWVKHPRPKCPKREEEFPFLTFGLRAAVSATRLGVFVCFYLHKLSAEDRLMNQGKGFCFLLTWRWVSSLQTRRVKMNHMTRDLKETDKNHLASVRRGWETRESSLLLREGLRRCTVHVIRRLQSAIKFKICAGRDHKSCPCVTPILILTKWFTKEENPHATNILNLQLCHW